MTRILKSEQYFRNSSFPLSMNRVLAQGSVSAHAHEFTELVITLGGMGMHCFGDEKFPVMAGDVFVVPVNHEHDYENTEELSLVNILFEPHRLNIPDADIRQLPGYHALFCIEPYYRSRHRFQSRLRLNMEQLAEIEDMVARLEIELKEAECGCRFMATAMLMQLVCSLSRWYGNTRMPVSRSVIRLGEVITYLERNYADSVQVADLAAIAHMSERNFLRTFQEAMGSSPIDYLIRLRISRAAELLRHSEMRITEIAFETGFADSNYFSRQFRKIMGLTPREFRRG